MTASFARQSIIRKRYPKIDDQGTSVLDYSATPATKTISRCVLEPLTSTEVTDGRLAVATGYQGVAPYGTDLGADDIVEYDGLDYEIEGEPTRSPSPTGSRLVADVHFTLRRWTHGA